jgi:protein-tyrosine phosphatase
VIDLHAHLLPDLDDGPASLAGSIDMARAAHAAGIRTMVCTPHMVERYPTDPRRTLQEVELVREALDVAGVPLAVLQGAEIALSYLGRLDDEELRMASVGGGGRWLLLEMPFQGWPLTLPKQLAELEMRGYRAILAHPERAESIQRAPDRMRDLVGRGALVQLTAGSFLGEHGPAARRAALMLLGGGVAHFLGSDAHSAGPWRPPELEAGLQAAADGIDVHPQTLRWMVEDGPTEVIEGRPVRPPRLTPRRRPRAGASPAPASPRQPSRG